MKEICWRENENWISSASLPRSLCPTLISQNSHPCIKQHTAKEPSKAQFDKEKYLWCFCKCFCTSKHSVVESLGRPGIEILWAQVSWGRLIEKEWRRPILQGVGLRMGRANLTKKWSESMSKCQYSAVGRVVSGNASISEPNERQISQKKKKEYLPQVWFNKVWHQSKLGLKMSVFTTRAWWADSVAIWVSVSHIKYEEKYI